MLQYFQTVTGFPCNTTRTALVDSDCRTAVLSVSEIAFEGPTSLRSL